MGANVCMRGPHGLHLIASDIAVKVRFSIPNELTDGVKCRVPSKGWEDFYPGMQLLSFISASRDEPHHDTRCAAPSAATELNLGNPLMPPLPRKELNTGLAQIRQQTASRGPTDHHPYPTQLASDAELRYHYRQIAKEKDSYSWDPTAPRRRIKPGDIIMVPAVFQTNPPGRNRVVSSLSRFTHDLTGHWQTARTKWDIMTTLPLQKERNKADNRAAETLFGLNRGDDNISRTKGSFPKAALR